MVMGPDLLHHNTMIMTMLNKSRAEETYLTNSFRPQLLSRNLGNLAACLAPSKSNVI